MFCLTVKVKNPDRKYSREFTIYDDCTVSQDDPIIKACISETLKDFGNDAEDISFTIKNEVMFEPDQFQG